MKNVCYYDTTHRILELRITIAQHVYYVQMLLAMEKVFTDLTQVFTKTTSAASRISLCLRHEGVRSW